MKHILIEENPTEKDYLCVVYDRTNVFIQKPSPYKTIDLGLPSGTLWADRNIGTESPYDAGLYFQWGDTQGYTADQVGVDKVFTWDDYKFGKYDSRASDKGFSEYNDVNGKTVLDAEDDAATVNMGAKWRMPTTEQYQELVEHTDISYHTDNGGYIKFTSKEDSNKFLVFPASGYALDSSFKNVGYGGCYWSSSLYSGDVGNAYLLYFYVQFKNVTGDNNSGRCCGYPVRGVLVQ